MCCPVVSALRLGNLSCLELFWTGSGTELWALAGVSPLNDSLLLFSSAFPLILFKSMPCSRKFASFTLVLRLELREDCMDRRTDLLLLLLPADPPAKYCACRCCSEELPCW